MRTSTAVLLLFLATAAVGQDASAAADPDYSRDSLLRILADTERPEREPAVRYYVGAVEFRALGSNWRFIYLPIMMPFSGSMLRTSNSLPDPFELTGTAIATPPRAWRTQRKVNDELRRIERITGGKLKATVKVNSH